MKKITSILIVIVMAVTTFTLPAYAEKPELDKPIISKAVAKSQTIVNLYWEQVENADKYVIYFSTEKTGKYTKYGVTSRTSAAVKELKSDTTYYFRVRARVTVDGKNYYSKYSSAKKCTTKKPVTIYDGIKIIKEAGTVDNNSFASLTIQGKPNTEYVCSVKYSSKWSEANGLGRKTSDKNGYVTWKWKVGAKTKPGEHPIKISGGDEFIETSFTTVH